MTAKPTARKRPATPIISQRLQRLAEATARLTNAQRLLTQWSRRADAWEKLLWRDPAQEMVLRRCIKELERVLKP